MSSPGPAAPKSSGPARGAAPRQHRPWTDGAIFALVLVVVVVAQVTVLAVLGVDATATSSHQVCQVNFWIFHGFCTEQTTASPNAAFALQLANSLRWVFAVVDGILVVGVTLVILREQGAFGPRAKHGGPGHQLGGQGSRHRPGGGRQVGARRRS